MNITEYNLVFCYHCGKFVKYASPIEFYFGICLYIYITIFANMFILWFNNQYPLVCKKMELSHFNNCRKKIIPFYHNI